MLKVPMANTILIVEDEAVLREVLQAKLTKDGFDVETAKDGDEGVELIAKLHPDVVLLDIVMPKRNGYEVLEALKGEETMPAVIIISNSGQPVEIDRALALGAKDYIIKAQFTPEEVSAKVKRILRELRVKPRSVPEAALRSNTSVIRPISPKDIQTLIIEDDQFLRDLCSQKLKREGFQVSEAIDGTEGLRLIETQKPDVVLLDIILPGIDGFEVLRRVRSNSDAKIAKTRVILLSNLGQESDVERGMKLGANDYLIKANFTIDEIIEKVKASAKK